MQTLVLRSGWLAELLMAGALMGCSGLVCHATERGLVAGDARRVARVGPLEAREAAVGVGADRRDESHGYHGARLWSLPVRRGSEWFIQIAGSHVSLPPAVWHGLAHKPQAVAAVYKPPQQVAK